MSDKSSEEILSELGIEIEAEMRSTLTQKQERIIAGFEDIQRFVDEHGRAPTLGPDKDIFERVYATRLDQIKRQKEVMNFLTDVDHQGLLDDAKSFDTTKLNEMDNEALLAELGIDVERSNEGDITNLKNVKPRSEIQTPEEIGKHKTCDEFDLFEPLFSSTRRELKLGIRQTRPFKDDASVSNGNLFILSGQLIYIAEMSELFIVHGNRKEAQLRVIYDNRTESDIKMRSLQRALNKDENGRRVTDAGAGPLFSGEPSEGDEASGTIYVCRSKSDNAFIEKNRNLVHKIGVTSTSLERRMANAEIDPTFLMARVDVVATYELFNINRNKLENLLHRFFAEARINIQINDRFDNPVTPKEWFCVPLNCIEEAVDRIKDGTITKYKYDMKSAKLVEVP